MQNIIKFAQTTPLAHSQNPILGVFPKLRAKAPSWGFFWLLESRRGLIGQILSFVRSLFIFSIVFFPLFLFSSSLHLSISANPSRVNPILASDSASGEIAGWVFDSLLSYDKNAQIECRMCESYEFLDDTTLRFKLKNDIFWHDGTKFSAEDVVFTYEAITSPKVFTPYSDGFEHIERVEKSGEFEVIVKYKEPYFKALEVWMMGILPKNALQNEDLMTSVFNQKPIGTGPFKLGGFSISKDIELDANPGYRPHKSKVEKIIYHFIPDPSTQFLTLKSGLLDVGSLSPLQLERQIDAEFREKFNIFEEPSHSYTYLGFNLKNPKFQNPLIREALSLALDRRELADILFFGHAQICNGPFMPKTFAYNEGVKAPVRDLKRAKELLKKCGFDENNPFEFELSTNSNNSTRTYAAQIIQKQLLEAGVRVNLRTMEWQAFLNTVVTPRKFEAVLLGWGLGLMPDAYGIWHSKSQRKGGFNFVGYENKKVDELIELGEKTLDRTKLGEIYREIFALIAADNPYLFLYIPNSITAVSKKIKGVEPSIVGIMHNLIEWEREE